MARLLQAFQYLEQFYGECYDLYHKTLSMLNNENNSDIFNVITLSMLKNKVSDRSVNTTREMLETRMNDLKPAEDLERTNPKTLDWSQSESSLSNSFSSSSDESASIRSGKPRELKIMLTGDVDAGKSSVLNVLMGGRYLPSHNTKTTSVPCEIHNSNHSFAQICFEGDDCRKIELSDYTSDKCWKVLGEMIKKGKDGDKTVSRIKIFWPICILRDVHNWKSDPEHTPAKQVVGTIPEREEEVEKSGPVIPVVFLDLPGILDEEVEQVLEHIPEYHHFVIVVDCTAVIRNTLDKLLNGIEDKVRQHGVIFDPTAVIFLLNRSDQLDEDPSSKPLKTVILETIQKRWPIVTDSQLHKISCKEMLKGEVDIKRFKDTILDFVGLINRRNLEEHCFWLTKLLEGVAAYFRTGYNWSYFDQCLNGIKKHAETDNKCLQNELEKLCNGKTSFCVRLLEVAQKRKRMLKTHLTTEIQNRQWNLDTYAAISDALLSTECVQINAEYELEKQKLVDTYKSDLKKKIKLVEHLTDGDILLPNYVARNEIIVAVGRLVMTHVAVVQVPVRTLEEELQHICGADRSRDRNVVVNLLLEWYEKQAEIERQRMIGMLRLQRDVRLKMMNIQPMSQPQNTDKHRRLASIADKDVRRLHKIYVQHVLEHEFRGGFEEASKDCFVRYRRGKMPTSGGLPQHTDIYREMNMLRALTKKELEEKEKKGHFLLMQGTSSLVQELGRVLAILMERCDIPLSDFIHDLDTHNIYWKSDRQRLEYALGAAKGLQFMHENGFVHCDVKPENFLVKFGCDGAKDLVKICAVGHTAEMIEMAEGYGTREYCAPEVISSELYSTKSDVYGLGLVFWEMWYCTKIKTGEEPLLEPEPEGVFGIILPQCLDPCPRNRPDCSFIVEELEKELAAL